MPIYDVKADVNLSVYAENKEEAETRAALILVTTKNPLLADDIEEPEVFARVRRDAKGWSITEARCGKCGEIFAPHDECCTRYCHCRTETSVPVEPIHCQKHCLTLVHGVRSDGEECGGKGTVLGYWIADTKEKK